MAKNKKPVAGAEPTSHRHPSSEPDDYGKRKPVWKFSIMDFDGPFGCGQITAAKIKEIHRKLCAFETMAWNEIERNGQSHFMPPSIISKTAQSRLAEINQDDADNLFSLRLTGTERIWGIRDRHVYKILWWDPDHKVYPVSKKNT